MNDYMKRFTTILFLMLSAVICLAQSLDERKRQIAEIKKSGEYIYADVTANTEQDAFEQAEEKLYSNINAYIAKAKYVNENAKASDVYNVEKIEIPRANLFRAFLYVKATDIVPDEEEPGEDIQDASGSMDVPENAVSSEIPEEQVPAASPREQVLARILSFETFAELKTQLADMKQQGKIQSYAMYKNLAKPEEFILIIFDADGNVRSVLSEGKNRVNLKTNTADDIHNYKGLGAVGVKI